MLKHVVFTTTWNCVPKLLTKLAVSKRTLNCINLEYNKTEECNKYNSQWHSKLSILSMWHCTRSDILIEMCFAWVYIKASLLYRTFNVTMLMCDGLCVQENSSNNHKTASSIGVLGILKVRQRLRNSLRNPNRVVQLQFI